jgi:ribosomal protein S21
MKRQRTTDFRRESGSIQGASVQVRNDDVNSALRKLKKILETDNRQKDLAKHEFYEKSSVKRKRSRDQAKKRTKREQLQNVMSGTLNKPSGVKWMKSKRKRRRVLDADNLFVATQRKIKAAR